MTSIKVVAGPLSQWVFELIGLDFHPGDDRELKPTDRVATIANKGPGLQQLDTAWGFRPSWLAKPLTSAEAETVADKDLFKAAFEARRCVLPCSGWYECRDEGDKHEQRYSFTPLEDGGLLMAGIWFPTRDGEQFLPLSTQSTAMYAEFHPRMPLLIPPNKLREWVDALPEQLDDLLQPPVSASMQRNALTTGIELRENG